MNLVKTYTEYLDKYVFVKNGKACLCSDDAKYANHSFDPNTECTFYIQIAKIDIQIADEITVDYRQIDDSPLNY